MTTLSVHAMLPLTYSDDVNGSSSVWPEGEEGEEEEVSGSSSVWPEGEEGGGGRGQRQQQCVA